MLNCRKSRTFIGRLRTYSDPPIHPDTNRSTDMVRGFRRLAKTTLDAYEAIAVPELWIYDSGKLTIYLLRDGQYIKSDTSSTFPNIPLTQIIPVTVERAWQVGSVEALEEFERAIA